MDESTCTVEGCGSPAKVRGWCRKHYKRWANHGDPTGGVERFSSPEESFQARTERRGECLIWTASTSGGPAPYGRIHIGDRMVGAHVYSYQRAYGPIPDGMMVDHRYHCSTLCCEPTHLRLATGQQNVMNASGARAGRKHDLPRNVYKLGDGYRVRVGLNGKIVNIGIYGTLEDATAAAEKARGEAFGEYAGRG